MFKGFVFVLLLGNSLICFSQRTNNSSAMPREMPISGTISGRIMDTIHKMSLEYVSVAIYKEKDSSLITGAITDSTGKFVIKDLVWGKYFLEASFIGYTKTRMRGIVLNPQKPFANTGKMILSPEMDALDEVVITGEKALIEYRIDKKIINVSHNLTAIGGSAVEALENTPSIQTDIDGNVTLRGSANFKVLIDGKPTVLRGSEALQQIPAASIENIEIITNPSAKYDPEGVGGIINIIMKKNKDLGVNGIINASLGSYNKYKADMMLNYRVKKVNFIAGIDFNDRKDKTIRTSRREVYGTNDTTFEDNKGDGFIYHAGLKFKGGAEYTINDKNFISIMGEAGNSSHGPNFNNYFHRTSTSGLDEYALRERKSDDISHNYNSYLNYDHIFDTSGQKFESSIQFSKSSDEDIDYFNEYTTGNTWEIAGVNADKQKTTELSNEWSLKIKADYTKLFNKNHKYEAGIQIESDNEEGILLYEKLYNSNNLWLNDSSQSNELLYHENIYGVYSTWSDKILGMGILLGLRGEVTDRLTKQITINRTDKMMRFDFFPSIHISRPLPLNQELMLSYSRRINRPSGRELNPFSTYFDQHNLRRGNPGLQPEFTNSFELGYQKKIKTSFISLEGYYRETYNKINMISTMLSDSVMLRTFENIDRDFSTGVELMMNLVLLKIWNVNASGNIYNYRLEGTFQDSEVNQSTNTWDIRFSNTVKFPHDTKFQLTGMYNGLTVTVQGNRSGFFVANAALRKDVFKRKMSITLQAFDIFSSMKFKMESYDKSFYSSMQFTRKSPVFTFSISYKFNNYKQSRSRDVNEMQFNGGGGDMM